MPTDYAKSDSALEEQIDRVHTMPFFQAFDELNLPESNRNLFSSPQWCNVLRKTYGVHLSVKYITQDGKIKSYIIYSIVKNFLEWKICINSYCDYCDAYVDDPEDWKLYFASLRREYPDYRIAVRNLRDRSILKSEKFNVLSTEKFHILDTSDSIEMLWKRTHKNFKAAVKQSVRKGVTVKVCSKVHLKDFFNTHLQLRKTKYRLFPQPYAFFEHIWNEYMEKGKGFLLGAFDENNRFVAGNMYLICGDTLYYKFNTSRLDALDLRANNKLFWEGIKLAKKH